MALDGIGVLDHLGIEKAHIVGASMGGMIAQTIASKFPKRTKSLVSIMSTTGAPHLSQMSESNEQNFNNAGGWDKDTAHSYGFYPEAMPRQITAIMKAGDRSEQVRSIKVSTLVQHGVNDTLLPPDHGEHTAELINNSKLKIYENMGHNLTPEVLPFVIEDMVNFLFLMWLDAVHDEYISMSFVSFLESPMCTTYFTANHLNKARDYIKKMENTLIKNRKTVTAAKKPLRSNDKNRYNSSNNFRYAKAAKNRNEKSKELSKKNTNTLISKIVTLVPAVYEHIYKTKSNLKGKYERILKENLDILFGISKNAIDGPDCLNTPSVMYVSLDQEGRDTRTLSTIISKSKNMRNYITSGVLIDPGRTMHPIGITKEIKGLQKYIHSNKNSYDFKSIYHVYPYKINIKHNKQKFLNIEFTVSARGLMTAPSKDPKSYFGLKINPANAGKRHGIVTLGASGGGAKKNERAAMGKFLGDGLQYILIASQNKKKPKNKRVFATGDGMASVLAAFFAKRIFNVAPNIMVDLSLNSGDVIMYSDSTFKNSTNCSNKKPLPQKNHSGNTGQASMNWGNNNNNVTSK